MCTCATALWCVVDQGLAVGGEIPAEQLEKLHLAMPYLVDAPPLATQDDWDAWIAPPPQSQMQSQPRARVRSHTPTHRHRTQSTVSSQINESSASSSASSTLSAGPNNNNNNHNNNDKSEAIADPPQKRRSLSPTCNSMSVDGDEH